MEESYTEQLSEIRKLFAESAPTDQKIIDQYAWIIYKVLNKDYEQMGALACRQMLAEYMKLPVAKPSKLHSAMLYAATKIAAKHSDFHFIPFLKMWNMNNLREEDKLRVTNDEGKVFPSLLERVARVYMLSKLLRRDEELPEDSLSVLKPIIESFGLSEVTPMVVTKVNEAMVRGRKMHFAMLVANDGTEASCEVHALRPDPLNLLIDSKTQKPVYHMVKAGQLYDVILRNKHDGKEMSVFDAILSRSTIADCFPIITGYVEHIDLQHAHIHIYDGASRHFVAASTNPSANNVSGMTINSGQFVRFSPIIPQKNKFKSAIIDSVQEPKTGASDFGLRDIRITHCDPEKGYCAWELKADNQPIVEAGTTTPSYTKGYVSKSFFNERALPLPVPGTEYRAVIFLKRGKDGEKRPHIAMLLKA